MSHRTIVLISANAPRAGKDTVATVLVAHYGFKRFKFAQPLANAALQQFDITPGQYEDKKDATFGKNLTTPRGWMINLAEEVVKRGDSGNPFFGMACALRVLASPYERVVVSDCGFLGEVEGFMRVLDGAGGKLNLYHQLTVQRHSPGAPEDSREPLGKLAGMASYYRILNSWDLKQLEANAHVYARRFVA